MSNETLTEIEILLAHQSQEIHDLSDMVIAQGKEIAALKLRLDFTQSKLSKLELGAGDGRDGLSISEQAALDKPPHY